MRNAVALLGAAVVLAFPSCSSTPPKVRTSSQPDGSRCVAIRDRLQLSEAEPILLFYCAQATLEVGHRYFLITGRSTYGPQSNPRQSITAAMLPEFTTCFRSSIDSTAAPNTLDSRLVVIQADPALRSHLSAPARRHLEAIEASRTQ
ncbi:MAG: hypothetical protein U0529_10565 [Thermoanaerobaculia bacterium]